MEDAKGWLYLAYSQLQGDQFKETLYGRNGG